MDDLEELSLAGPRLSYSEHMEEPIMAVLVTADVPGQTAQGYDSMLGMLANAVKQAPGFVLHIAHPIEEGWRILEVWESQNDASQFFAKYVHPNLPPGIKPKRTVQALHSPLKA